MNKYLEKIALNAGAARAMAKQVGVIPDPTSAWKFALRNLRGIKGEPLGGMELANKKVKLGDITNNSFQKFKSLNSKHGQSGHEFSATVKQGKIVGSPTKGDVGSTTPSYSDNTHTHPEAILKKNIVFERDVKGYPNRLSQPSGITNKNVDLLTNTKFFKHIDGEKNRYLTHKKNLNASGLKGSFKDRVTHDENIRSIYKKYKITETDHLSADMGGITRHEDTKIVSPSRNVVSSTKISNNGIRTVYFDHTPRKAK